MGGQGLWRRCRKFLLVGPGLAGIQRGRNSSAALGGSNKESIRRGLAFQALAARKGRSGSAGGKGAYTSRFEGRGGGAVKRGSSWFVLLGIVWRRTGGRRSRQIGVIGHGFIATVLDFHPNGQYLVPAKK